MIKYFKTLNSGIKRLLIIGTIFGATIVGALFELNSSDYFDNFAFVLASIFLGIPVYWTTVFAGLWIYQGFEKDKKE